MKNKILKTLTFILIIFLSFQFNFGFTQCISDGPKDTTICENNGTVFTININCSDSSFQWQIDTIGDGSYYNITSSHGIYTDSSWISGTLLLNNVPVSYDSNLYKCIVDTNGTAVDTSDIAILTVLSAPTKPNSTDTTICYGNPTPYLTASGITGNILKWYIDVELNYLVNTGNAFSTGQSSVGIYTYYVTQTDENNGCESKPDTVILTINALPTADAGNDTAICYGESITLTASGGNNYLWNTTNSTASITVNPNETTTYTVTVTDSNFCSDTDEVTVTVNPLPTPQITGDNYVCANQWDVIYQTNYINGHLYKWNIENGNIIGNNNGNSVLVHWNNVPDSSGYVYVIETINTTGCTDTTEYFNVNFSTSIAPNIAEIILKGDNMLICMDSLVDYYQWGYYDNNFNTDYILTGETNIYYYAVPFDTINRNYWVITGYNNGCETKSYYNTPPFVGINNIELSENINIYPNPNKGSFIIEINNKILGEVTILIKDYTGREIQEKIIQKKSEYLINRININVKSGLYFVEIIFPKKNKFIKKMFIQ